MSINNYNYYQISYLGKKKKKKTKCMGYRLVRTKCVGTQNFSPTIEVTNYDLI